MDPSLVMSEEIWWETVRVEEVPDKEHKVYDGPELGYPAVAGALCVLAGTEAEIEANGDHVNDVVGSGVGGGSCLSNDGVHDSQGGDLFLSDGGSSSL